MILKVEIDLAEIWPDEQSAKDAIIEDIKSSVFYQVRQTVLTDYRATLHHILEKELVEKMKIETAAIIKDMIDNGAKCKKPYANEEVTIKDYISQTLFSSSGISNIRDIVNSYANQIGDELKRRYDLQFAATLINKMQDNNMLREDIAQLLLSK